MNFLSHISADWVSATAAALTFIGGVILLIIKIGKFAGAILEQLNAQRTAMIDLCLRLDGFCKSMNESIKTQNVHSEKIAVIEGKVSSIEVSNTGQWKRIDDHEKRLAHVEGACEVHHGKE